MEVLDVQEVYNIWKLLDDRYSVIDHLQVQVNFVHDIDFRIILNQNMKRFKREIKILEREGEKFAIKGPQPSLHNFNVMGNSAVSRDKDIAWVYYTFLAGDINTMIQALRDTFLNDRLRSIFMRIMKSNIKNLLSYIDYLKMKGWFSAPPLFPFVPNNVKDRISCNEVFFLWDHLKYRYLNIHLTKIYASFTYDADFKVLLDFGANTLENQANRIEDMLKKFGVTLPEPFSRLIPTPEATQIFDDKFMFTNILYQMKDASVLHVQSFVGSGVNTEVRKLFYELLTQEVQVVTRFHQYGKIKGWLPLVPKYEMD